MCTGLGHPALLSVLWVRFSWLLCSVFMNVLVDVFCHRHGFRHPRLIKTSNTGARPLGNTFRYNPYTTIKCVWPRTSEFPGHSDVLPVLQQEDFQWVCNDASQLFGANLGAGTKWGWRYLLLVDLNTTCILCAAQRACKPCMRFPLGCWVAATPISNAPKLRRHATPGNQFLDSQFSAWPSYTLCDLS